MKLVCVQFVLTDDQLNALTAIKRAEIKGWPVPHDLCEATALSLCELGITGLNDVLTHAGELVISAAGLESVVRQ